MHAFHGTYMFLISLCISSVYTRYHISIAFCFRNGLVEGPNGFYRKHFLQTKESMRLISNTDRGIHGHRRSNCRHARQRGRQPNFDIAQSGLSPLTYPNYILGLWSLHSQQDKLKGVRDKVKAAYPDVNIAYIPCDIRDYDAVRNAVRIAKQEIGNIDILVNNAGLALGAPKRFFELDIGEVEQM